MPTSMLHVRVDDTLKAQANEAFAAMGLSLSDAVRLLLHRVVSDQAFPLELRVADHSPLIRELDSVRLCGDLLTEQGLLPLGEIGTVVHCYAAGAAFEVEFIRPFPAVATLRREEIERVLG